MAGDRFDAQIAEVEQRIESRRAQMAKARDAWLEAAGRFLAEYWPRIAKETVQRNPEVVSRELGAAGVKAFRSDVAALSERSHELAGTHLFMNHRDIWPDQIETSLLMQKPIDATFNYYSHEHGDDDRRAAQFLAEPFGTTAGLLGDVARKHGLPLPRAFEERWERTSGAASPTIRARFVAWSAEMTNTINAYGDLTTSLVEDVKLLKRLSREKEEQEAADLWDRAAE